MRIAISVLLTALELGCAQVEVKDENLYGSLGQSGAVEFHIFATTTQTMDYSAWLMLWNNLNSPMVCMDSDSFADIKTELEDLCSQTNDCTEPVQANMKVFFKRVEDLK